MQDDNIETHQAPRYWDSWQIGHQFMLYFIATDSEITVTVLGPNCVWGVK